MATASLSQHEYIWNIDDLNRLAAHDDIDVRRWALRKLTSTYSDTSGPALASRLVETDVLLLGSIVESLASLSEAHDYESIVLERMREAKGARFAVLANAAAAIGNKDSWNLVCDVLDRKTSIEQFEEFEFEFLANALGRFGGDDARLRLWDMLRLTLGGKMYLSGPSYALLTIASHDDIVRLIQTQRDYPVYSEKQVLLAFSHVFGAHGLFDLLCEQMNDLKADLPHAIDFALAGTSSELETFIAAVDHFCDYPHLFEAALRDAERALSAAGYDMTAWRNMRDNGEAIDDYQRKIIMAHEVLEFFVENPADEPDRQRAELCLAITALDTILLESFQQTQIARASGDPLKLIELLFDLRDSYMDEVINAVVDLGPDYIPYLADHIDEYAEEFDWGVLRSAKAIKLLAERYHGGCLPALPTLISAMGDSYNDMFLQMCRDALVAIATESDEEVLDAIAPCIGEGTERDMYLSEALGKIPTMRSMKTLIDALNDDDEYHDDESIFDIDVDVEEWHVDALTEIGHPDAIDFIVDRCDSNDPQLAESLLRLCAINGIERPEMNDWRDAIARAEKQRLELDKNFYEPAYHPEPTQMNLGGGSNGQKKTVSKAEKKKRAKARVSNKRKKK